MEAVVNDLCGQLYLTKLEYEEIRVDACPLEEVLAKGQHCLMTKLLTLRPYNREAFKTTIKKIWRPVKPVTFHEMESDIIVVVFEDKMDKTRVMHDGP